MWFIVKLKRFGFNDWIGCVGFYLLGGIGKMWGFNNKRDIYLRLWFELIVWGLIDILVVKRIKFGYFMVGFIMGGNFILVLIKRREK